MHPIFSGNNEYLAATLSLTKGGRALYRKEGTVKLAILLTAGVETEDGRTVDKLARAAVAMGHEVDIFFMDDGVFHLRRLAPLMKQGAKFTVCAHNAYERGVEKLEGALFGGQNDWAEIVSQADRVVVFG